MSPWGREAPVTSYAAKQVGREEDERGLAGPSGREAPVTSYAAKQVGREEDERGWR
jgi:hypothetical protein